jgi:hypothetical protein
METPFALDQRLRQAARVPALAGGSERLALPEVAVLLAAGVLASLLTNLWKPSLGIPGSNIVFVAFPLALGFALVPRRHAGLLMAGGALAANAALWIAGLRLDGSGAQTSLLLTGPLLDLALRRFSGGWRLYAAFVAACATTNLLALLVRGATRAAGMRGTGMGGGRSSEGWWLEAVWTYPMAGLLAGLISVAAWFHFREHGR